MQKFRGNYAKEYAMRAAGKTWKAIGEACGCSRERARQRTIQWARWNGLPYLGNSAYERLNMGRGNLDEMFGSAARKTKAKAAKGISGASGWGKSLP